MSAYYNEIDPHAAHARSILSKLLECPQRHLEPSRIDASVVAWGGEMINRTFVLSAASIRDRAMACVGDLPIQNPPLEVNVTRHKAKRTQSQNARYWAMLHVMAEHTGHEADELHDLMRAKFLEHREVDIGGKRYMILQSTTRLSTAAMASYIERIEAWSYENEIPTER